MTAVKTATAPVRIPVNGKPVRARRAQMALWSAVAGFSGAALIAGIYFLVLQVNWHVHIGPARFQVFYLKHWWDSGAGVFHSAAWPLYRHGLRDLLEPAAATMGVKTLLAKPKWWGVRASPVRLAVTPPLLLALAAAMAAGGVWLLDFGLPHAWRVLAGHRVITAPPWISHSSWQILLLGFVIGHVLHRLWAPVGATLQGYQVERAVGRSRRTGRVPLWVRWALMPPVVRERFADMMAREAEIRERDQASRALLAVISAVCLLLVAAGFLAHYYIGTGHTVPYLAP